MNLLIAIRNVRLFTKEVLTRELQKQNIQLLGEIRFGKTPTDISLSIFAQHQSDPLYLLVRKMLKKSDNSIADAIYKKVGNTYWNKSATWKNSAKAIAAILGKNTGVNFSKMRIIDGSGLSRFNLVSPAQLVAVLRYAYRDHAIQQGFFTALPNAGVDGTMAYRLTKYSGRVHAKTGNMQSASSLAGYVETNSGEVLAFAIMINSFLSKPAKYHKLQDLICGILARS